MSEFKHLVLVQFKEGVVVEDVLKGMEKLVSEMDTVKSFIWGEDIESHEMMRQGFTHAFMMTFDSKDDFTSFSTHPTHVEFSSMFSTSIEKAILLDFPAITVKPSVLKTTETEAVDETEPAESKPVEIESNELKPTEPESAEVPATEAKAVEV